MRIFTNLNPFKPDIDAGAITTGTDLMSRLDHHQLDGLEFNLAVLQQPGGPALLRGLDFSRVTFHADFLEFNPGANNRYVRDAAFRQLQDELDLALERGVSTVTFHPGSVGKRSTREESIQRSVATLRAMVESRAKELASGRVALCVENMDDTPGKLCRTPEEIADYLAQVPAIGLTVDVAHAGLNELDPDVLLRRFAGRVRHLHVSGATPGISHKKVSLERSKMDMRPALTQFAANPIVACIENADLTITLESRDVLLAVRTG